MTGLFTSIFRQPAAVAIGAGLLAGAATGTAVVASGAVAGPAAAEVAVLDCPAGRSLLGRVRQGTSVLVTARSADGAWLELYVGVPTAERGWAPAGAVRITAGSISSLPAADCGAPTSAASAAPPTAPTSTPSPAPTPIVEACSVLPQGVAERIAGTALEPPVAVNGPDQTSCTYVGPVAGPEAQVQMFVGDNVKSIYEGELAQGHVFRRIPGVGDEAYLEPNEIVFRKGAIWAVIELVRLNDPKENDQPLIDGARRVAAALP